ncbi:hypothetical protein AMECASPLE_011144 [Ameca splendens]|uniref:Uncharacterized protein n=1 Tax=Ameca splendens TaxID=208324 RepID=A0ABV0XPM4_9TELE
MQPLSRDSPVSSLPTSLADMASNCLVLLRKENILRHSITLPSAFPAGDGGAAAGGRLPPCGGQNERPGQFTEETPYRKAFSITK